MSFVLFDDAIGRLVRAIETCGTTLDGVEATIVRGLDGRLRVVVEQIAKPDDAEGTKLKDAIKMIVPYAASPDPILVHKDKQSQQDKILSTLIESGRRRLTPEETSAWLDRPAIATWFLVERRLSKDAWITENGAVQEPWTYEDQASKVVSFYSFKGGVGRTTALVAFALYLADLGRGVIVIDLDLEAPGAGVLLQPVDRDLGVVDFLIEETVQPGAVPLNRFYVTVEQPLVAGQGSLRVFPAGKMTTSYLEKLGRIDVQGLVTPETGARNLLKRLLERVRDELHPDVILLDVRAGLHDLGGVSLSGLSHLELLFGLHTPASWEGLKVVLRHLGRLRADWIRLIHAMVPPASRGGDALHADFVQQAYDFCCDEYYLRDEVPAFEDATAPHTAYRLPYREALLSIRDLKQSRADLLSDEHRALCQRLAEDLGIGAD